MNINEENIVDFGILFCAISMLVIGLGIIGFVAGLPLWAAAVFGSLAAPAAHILVAADFLELIDRLPKIEISVNVIQVVAG